MKDIRDMKRSDWHRILERKYTVHPCKFLSMEGVISLIEIQRVTHPLTVSSDYGELTIADKGYSWVQLALKDQYFWATAMFNEKGEFLQIYFDITAGNMFQDMENPTFEDRYLDFVLYRDGKIAVLDQEELEEAWKEQKITTQEYEHTVAEGKKFYAFLTDHQQDLVCFVTEWRERFLKQLPSIKL